MATDPLQQIRFSGDRDLQQALLADSEQKRVWSDAQQRAMVRFKLLATAVRVDRRMLPKLDASITTIKKRTQYDEHMEAYVFEDSRINAFLTRGVNNTYLGLSSAAVNILSEEELEFVIGHELGHALFEHLNVQLTSQLQDDQMEVRARKQLLAWKRASEISADRCGLVCCGSIDVAASAMFRTLSGLSAPGLSICPRDFSEQWDHLLAEVVKGESNDAWQLSHPFPPLRMKAMVLFWESNAPLLPQPRDNVTRTLAEVDAEVKKLLATMDPRSRTKSASGDLLLADVLLWAGVAMSYASSTRDPQAVAALQDMVSEQAVIDASELASSKRDALERFRTAVESRHKRLRALEINRILNSLLDLAYVRNTMSEQSMNTFIEVAEVLGIAEDACQRVRERYERKREGK